MYPYHYLKHSNQEVLRKESVLSQQTKTCVCLLFSTKCQAVSVQHRIIWVSISHYKREELLVLAHDG